MSSTFSFIPAYNGNQTVHEYDALGNRVRTTYYTRKSLTAVPIGNILHPENNTSDYTITVDGFNENIVYTKVNPTTYNGTTWMPKFVHNPEGLTRHYSYEEHYPFYFIKDHLGNIRETYIIPAPNTKYFIHSMQYYPSGIPWKTSTGAIEHPYRYNGKELVQMHGQNEYDSKARWYYPAICRTTTMDPLCEKYYNLSPYAWCGNNLVNVVDVNGDSIQLGDNAIEVIMAIYNGLGNDASITLSFQNGILIPDNLKSIPSFDDNIFLQDLYELAIHPQMIEISSSVNNTYIMNGKLHQDNFSPPIIDDISSFSPEEQKQLRDLNYPEGRLIYGNLGQSLFPIKSSGKRSTNQNIQIILNAYSNLEVMTIGLAHEFAHVVLFLRGLPYRHGEANVDQFIFSREKPFYIKFGYDF